MSQYDRNHDGAALGASSFQTPYEDQRTVHPYTVTGSATIPNRQEEMRRRNMLHTTYLYLSVAVVGCMAGAWFGSHSEAFLRFMFSSAIIWIGSIFVLNMVPGMALRVAENTPRMAVPALGASGFVSGLILAPLVAIGLYQSGLNPDGGNLVSTACIVTGAMFAAVTAYIHINRTKFKPSGAVMWGLFGFAVVAIPANMFLQSSILSLVISALVGVLGLYQLTVATSQIVTNPEFNSPARGALFLFAGVFNLFQAVLSLLIGGSRD